MEATKASSGSTFAGFDQGAGTTEGDGEAGTTTPPSNVQVCSREYLPLRKSGPVLFHRMVALYSDMKEFGLLFYHLRLMPDVAALGEQIVGGHRTPGVGGVKFAVRQRLAVPTGADGIHNSPCGFHLVAADEQGGVAGDGFQQQPF